MRGEGVFDAQVRGYKTYAVVLQTPDYKKKRHEGAMMLVNVGALLHIQIKEGNHNSGYVIAYAGPALPCFRRAN